MAAPLGIVTAEPYGTLSRRSETPAILQGPRDIIEAEERRCVPHLSRAPTSGLTEFRLCCRNLLWLIYNSERLAGAQTNWAMLLDDQDIGQLLPVSDFDFAAGVSGDVSLRGLLCIREIDRLGFFSLFCPP